MRHSAVAGAGGAGLAGAAPPPPTAVGAGSCAGAPFWPECAPPRPLLSGQVHPVYQKRVRVTTKYQAHDEQQQCQVGDTVVLAPSRPLSKSKRCVMFRAWRGARQPSTG